MISDALTWLRAQRPEMERALHALVLCSSHTADKTGVDRAGAALRELVPLDCEVRPSARFGDHLFFHHRRGAGDGGAVLVGHVDTVFPREAFSGMRIEGDVARGPGVLDMKGGLVVIAFALQAMRRAGLLDGLALSFAVVSDEEVGSPDSAAQLAAMAKGAGCALVFEAGRRHDAIVTRRKGTGSLRVEAHGRAAHAGLAHAQGANAIWSLARFIDGAQQLTDYDRGLTVNVGRIEGGIGRNTVPDRASLDGDFRYVTRADGEALLERLRALASQSAVAHTSLAVEAAIARAPLERTEASAQLFEAYARCQREAGLGDGEAALQGGGSDASTTAGAGVPSIDGLGPRGDGFHTLGEHAELTSFVPKAEALVRFLCGLRGAAVLPG